LIQDIFNAQQKDLICSIFNPPSYPFYRELTYIGRITVIKTRALPILIQSLTVLPNPPEWVIKEIQ
jgi:hypothetical protein